MQRQEKQKEETLAEYEINYLILVLTRVQFCDKTGALKNRSKSIICKRLTPYIYLFSLDIKNIYNVL